MRYNETNSEQIGGRTIISEILDDNTIIEVSAQVMSDIYGKLQANYDLIVYGNIEVETLTVMGDLVCFGNCKADSLNVQGRCDIFGDLEAREALLSDDLRARELIIEEMEVVGKVICDTINCQGKLIGHNKVIVSEGIMGEGQLKCDLVICGEYSFAEGNSNVIVVSEIEERLERCHSEEEVVTGKDVREMDWRQCEEYLHSLSAKNPDYKQAYEAYLELYKWSEFTKIQNLNQYIKLTNLMNTEVKEYKESDLYCVIKEELLDKSATYVFDLSLGTLSQEEFAEMVYHIYKNKSIIPNEVYDFLREKIYNKIGLKYSTVTLMLGE